MKRHSVVLEESAQADVRRSYEWGCRYWGKRSAQKWARELRTAILKQLRLTPNAFPIAPEDSEFAEEIRQLGVGRYRVLFTIMGRKVHVLHIRGAVVNPIKEVEDDPISET
jgi:plasmid stabilization system protein ParE